MLCGGCCVSRGEDMKRDWDKLRRQARARAPLSRSQEMVKTEEFRKARRKHFRRKNRGVNPRGPVAAVLGPKTKYKPLKEVELSIEGPQGTSRAIFRRENGCWHCKSVNNPRFEWFVRVRHLDKIKQWLIENRYEFNWIKQSGKGKGSADEHSTDPMLNKHCAVSSLKNQPPSVTWDDQTPARTGLERNGVTTSSPLNATA